MLTTPNANRDALRQALLAPHSVAIIGQSNDVAKTAGRPLNYLRRAGFGGAIYCVNARRGTVLGERAYPSVAALPEAPDHAYILVPTEAVIDAVAECGKAGVKMHRTLFANGKVMVGHEGCLPNQYVPLERAIAIYRAGWKIYC